MGISQIVNDLALSLGIELPPWSGAAAALLIFAFCFPIFLRNARAARAKKMLKRSDLSSGAEREVFEKKAIDLVGTNPHGLLTLADTAQKLNRYTLANELLNRLPKTKKLNREARRLRNKMTPRGELTIDSAAFAIENLLQEGLYDAANDRLDKALLRWPNERLLLDLKSKIASLQQQLKKEAFETATHSR